MSSVFPSTPVTPHKPLMLSFHLNLNGSNDCVAQVTHKRVDNVCVVSVESFYRGELRKIYSQVLRKSTFKKYLRIEEGKNSECSVLV